MYFNQAPFLRLTFPFALGIVVYHYLGDRIHIGWYLPLLLFALFMVLAKTRSRQFSVPLSYLAMVILFMFGFLRLQNHRLDTESEHLLKQNAVIEAYEAIIVKEPALKKRSVNLVMEVQRVLIEDEWHEASGLVNAYAAQEGADELQYGDVLLIKGAPQRTTAPANPGEFDFANYLVYNNMFHQQFIGDDYLQLGNTTPNWVMKQSYALRQACKERLTEYITDPQVRSVMLAITLGIKNELDNDLQGAFSASGAMHVLAVSGLHVGIIYMIVLLVFKSLKMDAHRYRWLMAISSVLILWLYAFVTGLSPSVLRAVTMFSFVALARAMNRNSNIYNTLAASAFVLLWYNPYLLMSVGFQLSYLAVFGIVYLQPRFYELLTVKNSLLDKVWAITCVSLAAQIATAPLSILYFHQFPSYFLISNLFIIPAAFVMLIMGLLSLILSGMPLLGEALGWLCEFFVGLVNQLVFWVEALPGSTVEGIRITTGETWLVYAVLVMLILLFRKKKLYYLVTACFFALTFSFSQGANVQDALNSSTIRILNVSNSSVIDFRSSNRTRLLADSSFLNDRDRRSFHFEPGRLATGAPLNPEADALSLVRAEFMGNPLICFKGETFLVLKNEAPRENIASPLKVDHLVLSHNVVTDLDLINAKLDFDQLIIDSSYKAWLSKKLVNQAKALDLKVHAIREDGYYEKLWRK